MLCNSTKIRWRPLKNEADWTCWLWLPGWQKTWIKNRNWKVFFNHLHISCIVQANSDSKPLGVGIGLDNCSSALAWTMQLSGAWHVGTGGNTQQTVFINTYRLCMIFGKAGEKVTKLREKVTKVTKKSPNTTYSLLNWQWGGGAQWAILISFMQKLSLKKP